jgi:hypothetical protein
MPNFEKRGMSKEEISDARVTLEKEASGYAGREREGKLKLYLCLTLQRCGIRR